LQQLQSRILNVSSSDVKLFSQMLREYHDSVKIWAGSS
jgi:hypothetical protein